ncbi:DUF3888 domain-containing protein [Alkalihalobacillus sp. AL-G]|uniref:DUF3888 domain-containing protein n=1 Tax=Alkalihalobacillus sp. AL-G TaxID=2926399 RepID=UPI00272AE71D|nr:DUF3888 domain-containing protein [Alkalihalobacillus sp. AL-G]WLD92490.1 DUF3888 domain-containing protein [Alkalihalobacillus sp. AL-G]
MRKYFVIIIATVLIIGFTLTPSVQANNNLNDDNIELLEDTLISTLSPVISNAVDKYFGKVTQTDCDKILNIEKLQPGYKIRLRARTFEGPHNPPHYLVYLTLIKKGYSNDWIVEKITSKKLSPSKKIKCQ